MVETGAPSADAATITPADAPCVATPSSGCSRTIPVPIVRTIRQPPSTVPSVSASALATAAQAGEPSPAARPSATSRAAITPTDFCASLAPWPNERAADVTHPPARTGPRQRRVARRPARRSARIASSPASAPSTGDSASATSVSVSAPQPIATPPAAPAPTSPPTSA